MRGVFRVLGSLTSLVLLVVALSATGCSGRQRFAGTWHYANRQSGPVGYSFNVNGRYREYYKWESRDATEAINGSWGFGFTDNARLGVILKADRTGSGPCGDQEADGVLAYRFAGDDLYLEDERLVR